MKKEKNTFENEVIKIDNIIVRIDPETKEYKFAILRTFNNFPIEVDLRNKRVPKNSNREYRKLVKITKEQIEYLVKNGCMPDEDGEVDLTDYKEASLKDLTLEELKDLAKEKNIKNISKKTKEELIKELEETDK